MLPEFPKAEDAIQEVWNRIMFSALGFSDPLISQVPVRVQKEGHRATYGESEIDYKKKSVSYTFALDVGKGIPTREFFATPLELGKQIAEDQARNIFQLLTKPTPYSGTLDKSDGPLTFDVLISKIQPLEIDFDEQGVPIWPQWFLSEGALAEVRASMNDGLLTPEQTKLFGELVIQKRMEFDEREACRRLVD